MDWLRWSSNDNGLLICKRSKARNGKQRCETGPYHWRAERGQHSTYIGSDARKSSKATVKNLHTDLGGGRDDPPRCGCKSNWNLSTGERKVGHLALILSISTTVLSHCQWYSVLAVIIFTQITKAVTLALGLPIMSATYPLTLCLTRILKLLPVNCCIQVHGGFTAVSSSPSPFWVVWAVSFSEFSAKAKSLRITHRVRRSSTPSTSAVATGGTSASY
jgi:hypothetical protein